MASMKLPEGENLICVPGPAKFRLQTSFSQETLGQFGSASEALETAVGLLDRTGGELKLGRGTFALARPLHLPDRVTLSGSGRGSRLTGTSGEAVLSVDTAREVVIEKLAVVAGEEDAADNGILIHDSANCTVSDCLVGGFGGCGILLRQNTMLTTVRGCSLAGNRDAGVRLANLARGRYGEFVPNRVEGCTIWDGGMGISLQKAVVANLCNNLVYQTNGDAYHLMDSNSILLSGNRSFQITGNAVYLEKSDELNVSANIFCWHTGHGIVVNTCKWGTISGNEIIDTGSWNCGLEDFSLSFAELDPRPEPQIAVTLLNATGVQVVGNSIFNWPCCPQMKHGIYEDATSRKNGLHSNNINHFEDDPIVSDGRDSSVHGNTFEAQTYHPAEPSKIQSFRQELTQALTREVTLD